MSVRPPIACAARACLWLCLAFLPALLRAGVEDPSSSAPFALTAVLRVGPRTLFCIRSGDTQASRWYELGVAVAGGSVVAYDPAREVVRFRPPRGGAVTLELRQGAVSPLAVRRSHTLDWSRVPLELRAVPVEQWTSEQQEEYAAAPNKRS